MNDTPLSHVQVDDPQKGRFLKVAECLYRYKQAQVYYALKALERAAYVTRVLRPAPKGRENPVYVYSVTEIGGEAMKVARSFYRKALKRSP